MILWLGSTDICFNELKLFKINVAYFEHQGTLLFVFCNVFGPYFANSIAAIILASKVFAYHKAGRNAVPIGSMYGISTYIYCKIRPNTDPIG